MAEAFRWKDGMELSNGWVEARALDPSSQS